VVAGLISSQSCCIPSSSLRRCHRPPVRLHRQTYRLQLEESFDTHTTTYTYLTLRSFIPLLPFVPWRASALALHQQGYTKRPPGQGSRRITCWLVRACLLSRQRLKRTRKIGWMSMTLKCTTHELLSLTIAIAGLQYSAQQRDAASTASSLMPTRCISHLLDNDTAQTNKMLMPARATSRGRSIFYVWWYLRKVSFTEQIWLHFGRWREGCLSLIGLELQGCEHPSSNITICLIICSWLTHG